MCIRSNLTSFVVAALVITTIGVLAEAGSRRTRREARRHWRDCCPTWECIPQNCPPNAIFRPPVPDPDARPTGLSTERAIIPREVPVSAEGRAVAAANNAFAFDLYRRIAEGEGNRFFSPIGISMGLALLSTGAADETRQQILDIAHLQLTESEMRRGFADLNTRFASGGNGYQLRLANRLWLHKDFPLVPQFAGTARHDFGAEPGTVNFNDPAAARETINRWGAEKTEGRIAELLSPTSLNEKTRFVLTSGIYFKGNWKYQFVPAATSDAPFHVTPDRDATTPMMHQTGAHQYGETADLQILELPYAGEQVSMVVLLPRKVDGLPALEASLSAESLAKWLAGMQEEGEVEIHLPKFTFTSQVPLKDELSSLGMPRAFRDDAQFPSISAEHGQKLNEALQQAFIDVNEEGTEAAAVTGFVGGDAPSPVPRYVLFKADHPFVFLIRDMRSGAILFLGRVVEPKA